MPKLSNVVELPSFLETETLSDRVYRQLRRALKSGAYRPGEKITTRAVASALNVSLTPVREAMARLVSEGGLSMVGPKTVVVPRLSPEDYEEIFSVRFALEGMAAEMAAARADASFIDELEAIHLAFAARRAAGDFAAALELNEKFHFTLYRHSRQPRIVGIIESLWVPFGPSLSLIYPKFGSSEDGIKPHSDVISALRRGSPGKVRAAIENDLTVGRAKILPLLTALDTSSDRHRTKPRKD
ncbi:GntR family transcriptional regulator [Pelagibius sp.]|uniref:GntR family transcriptional regulator n=1 Tax=Pelagibius sp. TaxID=1931238 RepID=UPI003BB0D83F